MTEQITQFGKFGGEDVHLFHLQRGQLSASISEFGAALVSLEAPDRDNQLGDIVLGYDNLNGYVNDQNSIGVVVGRYANRIADGRFTMDGDTIQLPLNNGPNHLHGGPAGFSKRLWKGQILDADDSAGVRLELISEHGDQGYPGRLEVQCDYSLTEENCLEVVFRAVSDRPTVINLAQHSYFNLAGHGDIRAHNIKINADNYLPCGKTMLPLEAPEPVAGTPFDFRSGDCLGNRLTADHPQIRLAGGFDHNFILQGPPHEMKMAAELEDPASGRRLSIFTTQPGVQLYTSQNLDGAVGKGGAHYNPYSGVCLETQHFPDSPNRPTYPSVRIDPDTPYEETILYQFSRC